MAATKEELKEIFATKVPALIAELEEWFEEETAAIDGSVEAGAPSGSGGSIMSMRPAIELEARRRRDGSYQEGARYRATPADH